jgi:hypothetical protein
MPKIPHFTPKAPPVTATNFSKVEKNVCSPKRFQTPQAPSVAARNFSKVEENVCLANEAWYSTPQ